MNLTSNEQQQVKEYVESLIRSMPFIMPRDLKIASLLGIDLSRSHDIDLSPNVLFAEYVEFDDALAVGDEAMIRASYGDAHMMIAQHQIRDLYSEGETESRFEVMTDGDVFQLYQWRVRDKVADEFVLSTDNAPSQYMTYAEATALAQKLNAESISE